MTLQQTWTGPEPSDILTWTIVQAGHKTGRIFWVQLAAINVTPTQFGVLLSLDKQPGISNADLARQIHVAPQSMSELIASLSELQLIKKPDTSTKGKKIRLCLTDAGRTKLIECQQIIDHIEQDLPLTKAEAVQLNKLLHKIIYAT